MTNEQKNREVLKTWEELKEKITSLLSDLDSYKSNQEQIIERYERKLREKDGETEKLKVKLEQNNDSELVELTSFYNGILSELRNKGIRFPVNATNERVLEELRRLLRGK